MVLMDIHCLVLFCSCTGLSFCSCTGADSAIEIGAVELITQIYKKYIIFSLALQPPWDLASDFSVS
jgi:hypothetical protein